MRHGLAFYIKRLARPSVPDAMFENDLRMASYRLDLQTTVLETENCTIELSRSLTANKDVPERSAQIADVCARWISLGGPRMWFLTRRMKGCEHYYRRELRARARTALIHWKRSLF